MSRQEAPAQEKQPAVWYMLAAYSPECSGANKTLQQTVRSCLSGGFLQHLMNAHTRSPHGQVQNDSLEKSETPWQRCSPHAWPRLQLFPGSCRQRAQTRGRSEEHTSELQSHSDLVCRLLLEKKKN